MMDSLDRVASKLGVTGPAVIKVWLADRLASTPTHVALQRKRAGSAQR